MLGQLSGGQQRAQQDLAAVSSGHKTLVDRVARLERSLSALSHQLTAHTKSCGDQLTRLSGGGGQLAADRRHDAAAVSQMRAAVQRSVKTAAAAERSHQVGPSGKHRCRAQPPGGAQWEAPLQSAATRWGPVGSTAPVQVNCIPRCTAAEGGSPRCGVQSPGAVP